MIKLSIKNIESKLNKTIRKNCFSIGFDVAEKYTGVCILKTTEKDLTIMETFVITTENKEDHFHRADHYVASLQKFAQDIKNWGMYKILVIERCYYGQNPEVLIHLAHFGILTYFILKKEFDTYYYFGATTARSMIGFNQKRQEEKGTLKPKIITRGKNKGKPKKIDCKSLVHDYLKTDFGLEFKTKDEADSFVLALAGLLK